MELTWQPSLLGAAPESVDTELTTRTRTHLDTGSWVDVAPGFVQGSDALFDRLVRGAPWHQPEVTIYERRLPQPRLTAGFPWSHDVPPEPAIEAMRDALDASYGVDFDSVGLSLYRDGSDSVAWHRDRHARRVRDPTVAIVSLGSPRRFLLRPEGGGPSRRFELHGGDLLVMGGACQHRWQHSVPKRATAGPRISIVFRHDARGYADP